MKLYMFRTVRLSIIRSLFTVHSAMVYVIQVCRQLSSRSICSCSKAVYKPVWHIPWLSVQWINWWWTDELSETCRVSWENKFVKFVHLVGFITKKKYLELFIYFFPGTKPMSPTVYFTIPHCCISFMYKWNKIIYKWWSLYVSKFLLWCGKSSKKAN